jgi:class 3 adenylate cyclase
MAELPEGTVTFLFTDIEGSTQLLHELGEGYAEVLAEHRRVLRRAIGAHEGVEVDTQGDAFFVAFGEAGRAVAAARDAQLALAGSPVRVRMGIHTASRPAPTKAMSASTCIAERASARRGTADRCSSRR